MSVTPILYGPSDTSQMSQPDFLCHSELKVKEMRSDSVTVTIQIPKHTSIAEGRSPYRYLNTLV